ncbi:MAG TPA: nuclear transport factor 2 family protein [Stellaceae bacterium]|nr:nuclear transport factor 2 family protein [Stellaceae bacterium]
MVVDQIHGLLTAKADALVRRAADDLAALIDPGFIYVNASGKMFDKATYIDVYCVSGRVVFSEQKISDLEVRRFDGCAVATFIVADTFAAGGRTIAGRYRSLCVFSGDEGLWRWAAGQTMAAG